MEGVRKLETEVADALELIELAEADGDAAMVADAMASLRAAAEEAKRREIESLLSGEADGNDCYIELNSGAGGTEAQDWAQMLMRMYMRWAEQHGYKVQLMEESEGEQAGIKSATLQVSGPNAYGWLKTEAGVHRLVRISPFDANARRQTSFASVWVYPVVDDSIEIEINEADLKVDTYRASGAGGQHVNKTESAIRITHVPSASLSPARPTEASTATGQPPWPCSRPACTRRNCSGGKRCRRRRKTPRRISAGATRSATMCLRPINWSRICGQEWKRAIPTPCWTVTLTRSWRRRWRLGPGQRGPRRALTRVKQACSRFRTLSPLIQPRLRPLRPRHLHRVGRACVGVSGNSLVAAPSAYMSCTAGGIGGRTLIVASRRCRWLIGA